MSRACCLAFRLLMLFAAVLATSCSKDDITDHVDLERFERDLIEHTIRPWHDRALRPNGFFATEFDRFWGPVEGYSDTLVYQSRLIYMMALAYDVTGEPEFRRATEMAADFLLEHARDPESGQWYRRVAEDGALVFGGLHPYGYTYVIFALSHAYRVTEREGYLQAALETWQSDVWAGLTAARQFASGQRIEPRESEAWSQNPLLHLFEALLALYEVTGNDEVWNDVKAVAKFLDGRLLGPSGNFLPEWYDQNWQPLPDDAGGYVSLGHQMVWTFLLSRAVELGLDPHYRALAERLLDSAVETGVRVEDGALARRRDLAGEVRGREGGWWQQCELMRALIHFAAGHGRADLWPLYDKASMYARIHFADFENGGWSLNSVLDGGRGRKAIGYHCVVMYQEALRYRQK